jgi:hypothetical protein
MVERRGEGSGIDPTAIERAAERIHGAHVSITIQGFRGGIIAAVAGVVGVGDDSGEAMRGLARRLADQLRTT